MAEAGKVGVAGSLSLGLVRRLWRSPTAMTWASMGLRTSGAVAVLPLLLRRIPPEEVSIWYLLATIASINNLLDLGFNPSFSRSVAYARAGESPEEKESTMCDLYASMRHLYIRLAGAATLLAAVWGTVSLIRPMRLLEAPEAGWIAWAVTLTFAPLGFINNLYLSFLQGLGLVAEVRRWDALIHFCGLVSNLVVLKFGGGLVGLVISTQLWAAASVGRSRWMLAAYYPVVLKAGNPGQDRMKAVLASIWPTAWRFGLGSLFYNGALHLSGIIYAQMGNPRGLASYLMSFQVLSALRNAAQAPFYSKIPAMSHLWAAGKKPEVLSLAARGMKVSYWTYVLGFAGAALAGPFLLPLIKSQTEFADPILWSLMGLGAFAERYGGMHQNLISVTNRVVSHRAGAGFLLLFTATVFLGMRSLGVYVFPVAMLAGHLLFFAWVSGKTSYSAYGVNGIAYERGVSLPPAVCMIMLASLNLILLKIR